MKKLWNTKAYIRHYPTETQVAMREEYIRLYGKRGGTKVANRFNLWSLDPRDLRTSEVYKVSGKRKVRVSGTPTEFRVEIVEVNR